VRKDYLDRFPVQQAGGRDVLEYWIAAQDLDEFNANITGAILEEALYLGPVTDEEFTQVEGGLGRQFPGGWRNYLQGRSRLSRGWLENGCYLTLLAPRESLEMLEAWTPAAESFPGLLILGSDGSREMLAVDTRDPLAPVALIDTTSASWSDAIPQMPVEQLVAQIEAGTFEFTWE
jgi:hypothetical protein